MTGFKIDGDGRLVNAAGREAGLVSRLRPARWPFGREKWRAVIFNGPLRDATVGYGATAGEAVDAAIAALPLQLSAETRLSCRCDTQPEQLPI